MEFRLFRNTSAFTIYDEADASKLIYTLNQTVLNPISSDLL